MTLKTGVDQDDPAGWLLALHAINHAIPLSVFLLPLSVIVQNNTLDEERAQVLLAEKKEQVGACQIGKYKVRAYFLLFDVRANESMPRKLFCTVRIFWGPEMLPPEKRGQGM